MNIVVFTVSKRPHLLERVRAGLERQTVQPHAWIVIGDGTTDAHLASLSVGPGDFSVVPQSFDRGEWHLGRMHHFATDMADELGADLILKMDDDDYYGPEYIRDFRAAADLAQKRGHREYVMGNRDWDLGLADRAPLDLYGRDIRERHTRKQERKDWVCGATIAISRAAWRAEVLTWGRGKRGVDSVLLATARAAKIPILAANSPAFCAVRYGDEEHGHTWAHPILTFVRKDWGHFFLPETVRVATKRRDA